MINVPTSRKWSQNNSGEVFGMLHNTKNLNFDKDGYAQLAKRPVALVQGGTNFGNPLSVSYFKNSGTTAYYVVTDDRPFQVTLDGTATSIYDATYAPGALPNNDGLVWQGRWYITQQTFFSYHTGSAWNATQLGSLTSGKPHPLCIWENFNYLCVGDGNAVKTYDTTHTLVGTITLPSNYEVRWVRYNNKKIYIGTKDTTGGNAVMFVASDATAAAADDAWPVSANWLFSGVIFKSSVCVMTSRGQLLRFNGGGWDELCNLPVYYSNYSWFQGSGGFLEFGRMLQRGMATDGNVIYMNLDGYVGDDNIYLDNQPSGLWVYDQSVGLYHKSGPSNNKANTITVSSVSTSTDVITAGATYTALTGVKVFYRSTSTVIGGLKNTSYYYLIRTGTSTFKLAKTYANATAGTAIDLTGSGSGTQTFYCCDELDAGMSFQNNMAPGAIGMVSELDASPTASTTGYGYMTASQVLFGALIANSAASGIVYTLQSIATSYNRGYFVSQKIFSPNIIDNWSRITVKCNRLFQSSDKVIAKSRTNDKPYYPIAVNSNSADAVVWVTGTSVTSTADLSAVAVGEEIEFTAGRGAGLTAHITAISLTTGTYTLTLDETIPGITAGDKSGFAIQNWSKIGSIAMGGSNMIDTTTSSNSDWLQIKIEMRGHSEPLVEEVSITNTKNR